jgi:hypothetical protein
LKAHCLDCHGADTQERDVAFHELEGVDANNIGLWLRIWEQVSIKEMPPKEEDQPEAVGRYRFNQWLLAEFDRVKAAEGGFHKHRLPEKGNHLDHDLLFGPLPRGLKLEPPSTPARTWRVHPHDYLVRIEQMVHRIDPFDASRFGANAPGYVPPMSGVRFIRLGADHGKSKSLTSIYPVFSMRTTPGISDYPHLYSAEGPEVSQHIDNAGKILRYMMYGLGGMQRVRDKPSGQEAGKQGGKKGKGGQKGLGLAPNAKTEIKMVFVKDTWAHRPASPIRDAFEGDASPSQALQEACVTYLFENLIYRSPTDRELKAYSKHFRHALDNLERDAAIVTGLTPVFLHPEALFRHELVKEGAADAHSRVMMRDEELALAVYAAFSYLPPDAAIRKAVRDGKLRSREDVAREVRRILEDDSIHKARVLRFFQEYFDYPLAIEVGKDNMARLQHGNHVNDAYYKSAVSRMINNADRLVQYFLQRDKQVLKELLTTDLVVVGHNNRPPKDRQKRNRFIPHLTSDDEQYYRIFTGSGKPGSGDKPKGPPASRVLPKGGAILVNQPAVERLYAVETSQARMGFNAQGARSLKRLPKDKWCGILTHPVWLIAQSDAMDNHAVHRGKWVRERLLGGGMPDVPIEVDAMLPDEPHSTLRHRMRKTRDEACWMCHRKMDPIGLLFENYNHVGYYRTLEQGEPIDTSGEIIDSAVPELNRKYGDAIEMIRALSESEHVHQVFVRHAFRFWIGRNETVHDAPVLQAAYKAYKDNDGSMKALLLSLMTSDAFLYRKRKTPPPALK